MRSATHGAGDCIMECLAGVRTTISCSARLTLERGIPIKRAKWAKNKLRRNESLRRRFLRRRISAMCSLRALFPDSDCSRQCYGPELFASCLFVFICQSTASPERRQTPALLRISRHNGDWIEYFRSSLQLAVSDMVYLKDGLE